MSSRSAADEGSRVLGGLVCLAATLAGVLFLYGLSVGSYWALALPLAALVLFVLGLVFWVGWTIATVQIEAEGEPLTGGGGPGAATVPDPTSSQQLNPRSGTS
jgi:hypothetical protein